MVVQADLRGAAVLLIAIGFVALLARLYVDYWYWPLICTVVGIGSLVAGVFVWLKRRDHRAERVTEGCA